MSGELNAVKKALSAAKLVDVEISEKQGAVVLEGLVKSWQQYIEAGYAATGHGFRGVVNDLEVEGLENYKLQGESSPDDFSLEKCYFDVIIIGGGVIGCAIARELTRYNIKVALLEKESDVARHMSSRNNGMIHPAMAVKYRTKKHYYNLHGNRLYDQVAEELGFDLAWPGSLALLEKSWHLLLTPLIKSHASKKEVRGVRVLNRSQVNKYEKNVGDGQRGAIYMPESGVVSPYQVTVCYAENAIQNGATVYVNTRVTGFLREHSRLTGVCTNRGVLRAGLVINAAGIWADKIAEMAGDRFYTIHPRKGVIAILDKKTGASQSMILGRAPLSSKTFTKGGGLTPLLQGNILAGPTADEVHGREDYTTSPEELQFLKKHHLPLNKTLDSSDIITYFAGTRACTFEEDFIVEASKYIDNLVHVAGIQSPGLASAPAIAVDVYHITGKILSKQMELKINPNYNPVRKSAPEPGKLRQVERNKLIADNPAYGKIVCRCELTSEGEIVDAIGASLPAKTIDAVKWRTRAGMGRCQGGFCTPAVINILARETGCEVTEVCKHEPGSELILGKTRDVGSEKSAN